MVGKFSAGALGEEVFASGVVDVVEGFVGGFAALGGARVDALVDVAEDFLAVVHQIGVFAGFVNPFEGG